MPQRPGIAKPKNLAKHPKPNRNPASMTARECAIRKKKDKHIAAENRRRVRKAMSDVVDAKRTLAELQKESEDADKVFFQKFGKFAAAAANGKLAATLKAQST